MYLEVFYNILVSNCWNANLAIHKFLPVGSHILQDTGQRVEISVPGSANLSILLTSPAQPPINSAVSMSSAHVVYPEGNVVVGSVQT